MKTGSGKWALINHKRGYTFIINNYTKWPLDSLSAGTNWENAYAIHLEQKSLNTNLKLDYSAYKDDVQKMIKTIKNNTLRPRRALTLAMTLLPATMMKRVSRWFVGPVNTYAMFLTIIVAAVFLMLSYIQNRADIALLFMTGSTYMIYIILFVASSFIFHEIGHGTALDKFGHNPGRLGVGVFLIYPVFFTEFLTIELMRPGDRFWVNISTKL